MARLAPILPIDTIERAVRDLAGVLVEDPACLDITSTAGEQAVVVEIRGPREMLAHLIGRQGRRIEAIRCLMVAVGARVGRRVRVEVIG